MNAQVIDLEFRPRKWQHICLTNWKRFNVLVIHRRAGKTVLAIMKVIDDALRNRSQNPRYGYVAPFRNQAREIAWVLLKEKVRKIPNAKISEADLSVTLPNGAVVKLYGADNADALRGGYFDGVVLDEYADFKDNVFGEIILPMLADRQGWCLIIGTPKGINRFSDSYYSNQTNPIWQTALYHVLETGALSPEEIALQKSQMTDNQFEQEYMCSFQADNENTLFKLASLNEARSRTIHSHFYDFAPTIVGVDVARFGDDSTVFCTRQGLFASPLQSMKGLDSVQVASALGLYCDRVKSDAVHVDGTGGYGAGVLDAFRLMHRKARDVQFAGKADNEKFANKRAEMYWRLSEWIEQGGCLPDDGELISELSVITINFKGTDKLILNSKDEIKKILGRSPDKADALALTFAYPVSSPKSYARRMSQALTD